MRLLRWLPALLSLVLLFKVFIIFISPMRFRPRDWIASAQRPVDVEARPEPGPPPTLPHPLVILKTPAERNTPREASLLAGVELLGVREGELPIVVAGAVEGPRATLVNLRDLRDGRYFSLSGGERVPGTAWVLTRVQKDPARADGGGELRAELRDAATGRTLWLSARPASTGRLSAQLDIRGRRFEIEEGQELKLPSGLSLKVTAITQDPPGLTFTTPDGAVLNLMTRIRRE